jgi:hypothetical protein
MNLLIRLLVPAVLLLIPVAQAKVSQQEADQLGKTLTPLGGEKAANKDGSIPAWDGGWTMARPAKGQERSPAAYPLLAGDKPLFTVTAANLDKYKDQISAGQADLLKRFSDYKMDVYPTRRTAIVPDYVNEATKKNAVTAELANNGESLLNAVIGIPFPIPKSGIELMWNHKTRFRGQSVTRYNVQLAVQTNGDFLPYVLREDVRFHYNLENQTSEGLGNVIIYFLQLTTAPARQAGNVLLIHETMDQIKEARRAWLYNPGQRRTRRAPNVAYDNPGTGSDGLRTNDQLDAFNGATDRYTWKLNGKKEMLMPYNAIKLWDNSLKYSDIAKKGHINQDYARYEKRRVWVVEAQLKPGTSHIYSKRNFYIDEDTHSILAVDNYDKRGVLWRVQEVHSINVPWMKANVNAVSTIYDLQSGRYLVIDASNQEPLIEEKVFDPAYFDPGNVAKIATK